MNTEPGTGPDGQDLAIPDAVREAARTHPYPLVFATISGAHLYGFPSADSDWDLRGCHVLPARTLLGLESMDETVEVERKDDEAELDLVTHDAGKFLRLMLKPNGYVLEQLYSPLVVTGGDEHEELKELGRGCITRHHVHHYVGFARSQYRLLQKEDPPRVKPLLYIYRVLLTGIHLMRTGRIEADLLRLGAEYDLPHLEALVALKTQGVEGSRLEAGAVEEHRVRYEQLLERLEQEGQASTLPEAPSSRDALSDFLVRLRLGLDVDVDVGCER